MQRGIGGITAVLVFGLAAMGCGGDGAEEMARVNLDLRQYLEEAVMQADAPLETPRLIGVTGNGVDSEGRIDLTQAAGVESKSWLFTFRDAVGGDAVIAVRFANSEAEFPEVLPVLPADALSAAEVEARALDTAIVPSSAAFAGAHGRAGCPPMSGDSATRVDMVRGASAAQVEVQVRVGDVPWTGTASDAARVNTRTACP
ncbi:MAG: hypothetical protein ACPGUV_13025 [Polyangiales bacterium]